MTLLTDYIHSMQYVPKQLSPESDMEESDSELLTPSIIPVLASNFAHDIIETANAIPSNAWELKNHHMVAKVLNSKLKTVKFILDPKTNNLISPKPCEKEIIIHLSIAENRFKCI